MAANRDEGDQGHTTQPGYTQGSECDSHSRQGNLSSPEFLNKIPFYNLTTSPLNYIFNWKQFFPQITDGCLTLSL